MLVCTRLEEEEKLVSAEGLYKKALALDEHFQDANEAFKKLQMRIQVSQSISGPPEQQGCLPVF